MQATGITLKELASSLDSPRSLERRRNQGRLARFESGRLYRLACIFALRSTRIGGEGAVTRWLKRPNAALGGPYAARIQGHRTGWPAMDIPLYRPRGFRDSISARMIEYFVHIDPGDPPPELAAHAPAPEAFPYDSRFFK